MRYVLYAGTALIFVVMAIASYTHTFDFVVSAGFPPAVAHLLTVACEVASVVGMAGLVSGLMSLPAAATFLATGLGIVTLANIVAGVHGGPAGMVLGVAIPALMIGCEFAIRGLHSRQSGTTTRTATRVAFEREAVTGEFATSSPVASEVANEASPVLSLADRPANVANEVASSPATEFATVAERRNVVRALRDNGRSVADIASELQLASRTVYRDLAAG